MSAALELPPAPSPVEIAARARLVLDGNNAVQLATLGGAWSPWILGAYFARAPGERDLDLLLMVELHGKSLANLRVDPRIAFVVSKNDATCDFLQGNGRATLIGPDGEAEVMSALTTKMPWFRLYTPCVPVRIEVDNLFVTSFELGWMPAKRLQLR